MIKGITRRSLMASAAGLGLGATFAGHSLAAEGDLLDEIKKRGFMRVGTFSIPPESWVDINTGEWNGIDADFTKEIAKSIGVEVDPIILIHAALGPALDANRVDVIAGLYKTPEREKVMAYNEVPFWYGIDVVVAPRDSQLNKLEDLNGKTIGTVRGSAQEIEAAKLKEKFGVATIKKYDTADPMLLDAKAGRLDAAIWWGYTFDYAIEKNPGYDLKVVSYLDPKYLDSDTLPATYYTFTKRGTQSLIDAFDSKIREMRASGEDKKIMAKYGLTNPAYVTGHFE